MWDAWSIKEAGGHLLSYLAKPPEKLGCGAEAFLFPFVGALTVCVGRGMDAWMAGWLDGRLEIV